MTCDSVTGRHSQICDLQIHQFTFPNHLLCIFFIALILKNVIRNRSYKYFVLEFPTKFSASSYLWAKINWWVKRSR